MSNGPPARPLSTCESSLHGAAGSAAGFAVINLNGGAAATVDATRSTPGVTVSASTPPEFGRICVAFPGLTSVSRPAVVSGRNTVNTQESGVSVEWRPTQSGCPTASYDVIVKSESEGGSGYMDRAEFVSVSILIP